MNTSNFEVLHFPTIKGGRRERMTGNVLSVSRTYSKGGRYNAIYLSEDVRKPLLEKGLTHVQVHIEKYTGSIFLVFLQGNDAIDAKLTIEREKENKDTIIRIHNKKLTDYLLAKVGFEAEQEARGIKYNLSKDLSNDVRFATYKIEF